MLKELPVVDFTAAFESVQKLADLNVAKIEAAVETQKAATKSLVELTEARIKAATEIKDYDGYVAFMTEQAELAQSSIEKLVEDAKTAGEEAKVYAEEVKTILTSISEAPKPAPKKSRAKKAA